MATLDQKQASELARSIKKMALGSIIAEYGALEIKDKTKQELKQRVNKVITSSLDVQRYFIAHSNCNDDTRKSFKSEFGKDENYLLSEIMLLLAGVGHDDLENIYSTLKQHIVEV